MKLKYYITEIALFVLITVMLEFIDYKLLKGNIGESVGIFLICLGLFIIISSRVYNKHKNK